MKVDLKKMVTSKCNTEEHPCAITFTIREELQAFNNVVEVFSSHGFQVKEFVDDQLCVLSRHTEGFDEAVKIVNNKIQIQALKETIMNLCSDLQSYCVKIE